MTALTTHGWKVLDYIAEKNWNKSGQAINSSFVILELLGTMSGLKPSFYILTYQLAGEVREFPSKTKGTEQKNMGAQVGIPV